METGGWRATRSYAAVKESEGVECSTALRVVGEHDDSTCTGHFHFVFFAQRDWAIPSSSLVRSNSAIPSSSMVQSGLSNSVELDGPTGLRSSGKLDGSR